MAVGADQRAGGVPKKVGRQSANVRGPGVAPAPATVEGIRLPHRKIHELALIEYLRVGVIIVELVTLISVTDQTDEFS